MHDNCQRFDFRSPQNLEKPSVKERISALEQRFRGVTIIVGVDRLDYIKGVPQKLHALELFLTQHPEWIGKVNFRSFYVINVSLCKTLKPFQCDSGRLMSACGSLKARCRRISKPAVYS